MSGPLAGVRVLEIGHMLAGPYCGLLLADLGAEVIKIEPPEGDIARQIGPHRSGPHNLYFASLNRGKRSLVLDLATDAGQRALHAQAARAQALVCNLRPGVIRRLGLDYATLRAHNPRLVCVALTGYGLDGIDTDLPAYDYIIQALTGVMQLTGEPDGPPVKTGYSAVDNSSGIMAALGLVAKLHEGRGGQVDVALHDVMLSQLNYLAAAWLNAGAAPQRYPAGGHPYLVPAQLFESADGHLALFISHDRFWARFAREVGHAEWAEDARFATMAARAKHRAEVIAAIGAVLRGQPTAYWVERLRPQGIVISGVHDLREALDSPLTRAREMVIETPVAGAAPLRLLGNPIKTGPGATEPAAPPPLLGEYADAAD